MRYNLIKYLLVFGLFVICACGNDTGKSKPVVYKGLYSFGTEIKTFTECNDSTEFWVTDNSHQLELQYNQLNLQNLNVPVYIEVEGEKMHSGKDGLGSEYDSTLVVKKLIKITKEIPVDMCN